MKQFKKVFFNIYCGGSIDMTSYKLGTKSISFCSGFMETFYPSFSAFSEFKKRKNYFMHFKASIYRKS